MSNDRINAVLALLAPHIVSIQEPIYFRMLLEELYDGAQDDLMADLCDTQDAARAWSVTPRRANAHIAKLHERYGVGRQLGGAWVLRRQDVEAHRPDQRFRSKKEAVMEAKLTGIRVVMDRQGERYQLVYEYSDDTETEPQGSYATFEQAYEEVRFHEDGSDEYEQVPIKDRT